MFGAWNWFDFVGPAMVFVAVVAIYVAVKWN